jgi:hypothetical protein|tara:strand:- start:754 stop:996 length:243 start_codon:yes stop_codon:yes gene_type:complete
MRTNTKLKLMSIITEKVTDFINNDMPDLYVEERERRRIPENELDEFIEGVKIDEEVGFKVIKEMRRKIKMLIKKGIDEEY